MKSYMKLQNSKAPNYETTKVESVNFPEGYDPYNYPTEFNPDVSYNYSSEYYPSEMPYDYEKDKPTEFTDQVQ